MVIIKLRKRDKRYKRLKRRRERFHRYKVDLAYAEYYNTKKNVKVNPISEDIKRGGKN